MATHPSEDNFLTASVWGDLAQHVRRLWAAVDSLPCDQHARYERVRRKEREAVEHASAEWTASDPLTGPIDFRLLDEMLEGNDPPTTAPHTSE
jgi:hypothetical protein